MPRVIVVDNYDSFTYNLVQSLMSLGTECLARHNDETSVSEIWPGRPDASGEIMGLRHRQLLLEGVRFHPESILTQHGPQLMQNWLTSL